MSLQPNGSGALAKVQHKTGEYIVEVMEQSGNRALVKTLAVLVHPTQGDLHHPYEVDVPIFHQRRALAYLEKVWVPTGSLESFFGSVPEYGESLRRALDEQIHALIRTKRFAERSLQELEQLRKDYFPQN